MNHEKSAGGGAPYLDYQVFGSYGQVNAERLLGNAPIKESSRAVAQIAVEKFKEARSFLDVGCSSGHLVRALVSTFGTAISYEGVDLDQGAIDLGRQIMPKLSGSHRPESWGLRVGEIERLDFADGSVDLSISVNVLEHLADPRPALRELLRVSNHGVIVRTLLTENTMLIKEARSKPDYWETQGMPIAVPSPSNEMDENGELPVFVYHNMWGKEFVSEFIREMQGVNSVELFEDKMFDPEAINSDESNALLPSRTSVVAGLQKAGPLLQPHHWIVVRKN